jgi:hypothetical protein
MVTKSNLPQTKSRLFQITGDLLSSKTDGRGVKSAEVVGQFMKGLNTLPKSENDEILRHGLMVLAGRVTTMNQSDPTQNDILEKNKLPLFVDLRLKDGDGKFHSERFDVRKLTPNQIVRHESSLAMRQGKSKRGKLIDWAQMQINAGKGDVPVEKI